MRTVIGDESEYGVKLFGFLFVSHSKIVTKPQNIASNSH
jgi:hypothetical protein